MAFEFENYEPDNLMGLIMVLEADMAANYDGRKKEVGDRVIIWDWSYSKDTGGKQHDKFSGYQNMPGIVIKVDCNFFSETFGGEDKICDLLVAYGDGRKIYTRSDFVRIVQYRT